MKNMKKKNQMIITALAIMIAVAGYLNFTGVKFSDGAQTDAILASSQGESVDEISAETDMVLDISEEDMQTGDSQVAYTDIESLDSEPGMEAEAETGVETGIEAGVETEEIQEPGEAVFTSGDVTSVAIVANAKLLKEQTRAKNKETLLEVINSASVSDTQKQTAIDGMIAMTDVAEREMAAENLLTAKGFSEVVVSVTGNTADVLVNAAELSDANRAQIEDIVQRKTGVLAENIVITPIETAE